MYNIHSTSHRRLRRYNLLFLAILFVAAVAAIGGPAIFSHAAPNQTHATASAQIKRPKATPVPFMHRPFYGPKTVAQRTTSFVDHDRPWYVNDGIFVRYDGAKWTNVAIGSCTGGVNCYDGHNGYDLNLWYEPVLSVAAGTVIRAGWYDPLNHMSALGLWAAVDHGNGYYTAYGHLSALNVSVGEQVGVQWQLGTSGTSGSSTGPHLHMATYYAPNWQATDPFGWSGNYPDPNAVPDNYLWVANSGTSNTIPDLSGNGSAVYPGATLVDDGGAGWSSTGNWNTATAATDIRGNLHWTPTTSGSTTATATWQPQLPADGYYELGVYVDDNHASSSWAPYTVYSVDPNNPNNMVSHLVYVDETHIGSFQGPFGWENTGPQWISLGTYYFRASMPGRVSLSNATGEHGPTLSADGMEFVPVSTQLPPPTTNSYAFGVSSDGTPSALVPGSTTSVNMTLTNASNFTWSAAGANPVQVVYHWLNAQNQVVATGNPIALPRDVTVNASVSLAVPVTAPSQPGAYTLQWDMQQGSTVFSSKGAQVKKDQVEVARYAESFGPTSLPGMLTPGASIQLNIGAQNKGALAWPASGSAPVTLTYRWLDSAGNPVSAGLVASATPGVLPADVPPGGSVTVPITLHTPVLAGNYRLVYDFQQGVSFSSQGATPLTVAVTITPNLPKSYYFAEGYTGTGTTEYLSLTNPSASPASISVSYLFEHAAAQTRVYTVAAQSHMVINVNSQVGPNLAVSMIVQGNQPFVAERSMYNQKGVFASASDSIGTSQLSSTWYFAEGNTTFGWNTLLAVLNPSAQTATLKVTYLWSARGHSGIFPRVGTYTVAPRSRGTFVLNQAVPGQQFGLAISASTAVAVERPEYLVASPMRGGSSVMGATSAQANWYFGAGSVTPNVTESLVLANPNARLVTAQVHYLTTGGQVITQTVGIPGQSRVAIKVNTVVNSATHATVITANGPIVAERQDFYNNAGSVMGSTTVMGVSNSSTAWYIAQGDTSGGHVDTLALANPGATPTQVQVVYYQSQGAPLVKAYTLPANTRMTITIASEIGANKSIGIAVYATTPIVVEQTMLYNASGVTGVYDSMGLGV